MDAMLKTNPQDIAQATGFADSSLTDAIRAGIFA